MSNFIPFGRSNNFDDVARVSFRGKASGLVSRSLPIAERALHAVVQDVEALVIAHGFDSSAWTFIRFCRNERDSLNTALIGAVFTLHMGVLDLDAVERRREPRATTCGGQPVLVDVGEGRENITCYLVNLSKRGACIMTPKGVALPYSFRISIEGRWRNADTIWNRWPQLGIQFIK